MRWRSAREPAFARQPVQDVAAERAIGRQVRVVEVVGRVARHPDPLHHGPRADVRRDGERHDLLEPSLLEPEREGGPRGLGRVAVAPGLGRQAPADLDRGRERRLEVRRGQPGEADERPVRAPLQRPQPEAVVGPPPHDPVDERVALLARQRAAA